MSPSTVAQNQPREATTPAAVRRISFAVHEVEPRPITVETTRGRESLQACLRSSHEFCPEVLASSVDDCPVLRQHCQNSLLAAVHLAFSGHVPLTLSPDMVWIAILQGFARHVSIHAHRLESHLMRGQGKHVVQIRHETGPIHWPELFAQFASGLDSQVADGLAEEMQCDFSTTGPVEKAASQVALMDVFSPYVQFVFACICGIPHITLEGEVHDWRRLQQKLARLRGFEADDWIDELELIAGHFARASSGDVDVTWWQSIYKLHERYGGELVEGWLKSFFPYTKAADGTFTHRRGKDEMITTDHVPPGLSDVAVKLVTRGGTESLRFVAGFVGVESDERSGIRARIGWAVVRSHFMESFVLALGTYPFIRTRASQAHEHRSDPMSRKPGLSELPVDLQLFYQATDGAELVGQGTLHPLAVLLGAEPVNHSWLHLGLWNDGSIMVANDAIARLRWTGAIWEQQVLALTFSDFVARMVAAEGRPYWQEEDFVEPVIQPRWMCLKVPEPRNEDLDAVIVGLQRQNSRLRSMQVTRRDVFLLHPPATSGLEGLPEALQSLYRLTASLELVECFELWPATQVRPVEGTCGRWLQIGSARGDRLLFDQACDRGVAVFEATTAKCVRVADSLKEFLSSACECPGQPFWLSPSNMRFHGSHRGLGVLWPDERIELPLE